MPEAAHGRAAPSTRRPVPEGADRRGRHATTAGQGFGYVVKWTVLGAVLPGSALIAAGRRRSGWTVAGMVIALGVLGLGWLAMNGSLDEIAKAGGDVAVDPSKLLLVAIGAIGAAVVLGLVLLAGHASLRETSVLTRTQRLTCSALVTTLLVAIAVPAAKGAQYALITRDLVDSVFSDTGTGTVKPGKAPVAGKKDPWAGIGRVNLLIMGSDAGKGREGLRPDSMILASIDTRSGDAVMFTIPRNLMRTPFPEGSVGADLWPNGFGPIGSGPGTTPCGETREWCWINAVWQVTQTSPEATRRYQDRYGKRAEVGLMATEEAVTGMLGLKPDYFVMLNLNGFKDFVDAIGGITVNVRAENERGLPIGGDTKHRVATGGWIKNGDNQHLDGYHALWFARSRWGEPSSDYSRMKRQRCAIAAISEQANPVKLFRGFSSIAASLKDNLFTDIPQNQLSAWVDLALRVKKGKVRSLPLFMDTYGGNYDRPDYDLLHETVEKNLKPPAPRPSESPGLSSTATTTRGGSKHATNRPRQGKDDASTAQDVKDVC